MARASTRIHIRWPPAAASEPTDTLVLSLGGYYVDLRVRKDDGSIDWALAGERVVVSQDPVKVKFTHIIDSQHDPNSPTTPAADVGDFTKLPNGDDLETGAMPNPAANGAVMDYEEVWRELDWSLGMADGSVNWILESHEDDSALPASKKVKTFYAKLGRYHLAISQIVQGEDVKFVALRQDFDPESKKWKTRYEVGDVSDLWRLDANSDGGKSLWKVGDEVTIGNSSKCIVRGISVK